MKKIVCCGALAVAVSMSMFVQGCSKSFVAPEPKVMNGTVYDAGVEVADALIMVCVSDHHDIVLKTDSHGAFSTELPDGATVEGVVAVVSGKTGATKINVQLTDLRIDIAPLPGQTRASPAKASGEYWFGVSAVTAAGDAKFRYQFSFSRFVCVNSLPWIWYVNWQNPDPNSWSSQNIFDYPAPWKGKLLLVPFRLQRWHNVYYGYPIHQALYLISAG